MCSAQMNARDETNKACEVNCKAVTLSHSQTLDKEGGKLPTSLVETLWTIIQRMKVRPSAHHVRLLFVYPGFSIPDVFVLCSPEA